VDELLHLLGVVGRVSLIYVAIMAMLRVSGRREMSELGPMDLITMLLVSETVSNSLTGGDDSIATGLVAAATVMALGVLMSWIAFRSRRAETLIAGEAVVLIEGGKVREPILHRYRITDDELRAALHKEGLTRVDEVKRAYVEADGQITMIKA
jgi:uncharacterized membrane protein YcaP (DUF421 family)